MVGSGVRAEILSVAPTRVSRAGLRVPVPRTSAEPLRQTLRKPATSTALLHLCDDFAETRPTCPGRQAKSSRSDPEAAHACTSCSRCLVSPPAEPPLPGKWHFSPCSPSHVPGGPAHQRPRLCPPGGWRSPPQACSVPTSAGTSRHRQVGQARLQLGAATRRAERRERSRVSRALPCAPQSSHVASSTGPPVRAATVGSRASHTRGQAALLPPLARGLH